MRVETPPGGRAALLCLLLVGPAPASAAPDPSRSYVNEIACSKAAGLTAVECRKAFAVARAEFEARTRSYPSRFACYRAYGPCGAWPATGGPAARFRPQWMGVVVAGIGPDRTAVAVIAAGRTKLAIALAPRKLSDPLPAAVAAATTSASPVIFAGGAATAVLCRQIAAEAVKANLPPAFLARLLWQESSFRPHVVSRAGALGIAQFMPGTAAERGLDDPFDPGRAIETSAGLLGDLARRFGNLGLAAAAYNGGPARVTGWLQGRRTLAAETETYVRAITGRTVQDWASPMRADALAGLQGPCVTPEAAR